MLNGKVFTGDPAHPYVGALAVGGGRILAARRPVTISLLTIVDGRLARDAHRL